MCEGQPKSTHITNRITKHNHQVTKSVIIVTNESDFDENPKNS